MLEALCAELIAAIVQEFNDIGIQHTALLQQDVDTEQLRSC